MISEEDIPLFEVIKACKVVSHNERDIIKKLYKKYIDINFMICFNCPPQVKKAVQNLITIYNQNNK